MDDGPVVKVPVECYGSARTGGHHGEGRHQSQRVASMMNELRRKTAEHVESILKRSYQDFEYREGVRSRYPDLPIEVELRFRHGSLTWHAQVTFIILPDRLDRMARLGVLASYLGYLTRLCRAAVTEAVTDAADEVLSSPNLASSLEGFTLVDFQTEAYINVERIPARFLSSAPVGPTVERIPSEIRIIFPEEIRITFPERPASKPGGRIDKLRLYTWIMLAVVVGSALTSGFVLLLLRLLRLL